MLLILTCYKYKTVPTFFLYLEIIKKIIAIGSLCLGIFVSIYCVLAGSVIAGIIGFFFNSYYTGKRLGYSSWIQLKDVAPNYGVALVVAPAAFFLKYMLVSNWIILPIPICVGRVVFLLKKID